MTVETPLPPESEQRFDIGSTPDSLDRMREIYARHGDAYRVYAPGRQSHTWVFNHPDDVRRILITNHRNYAKGVGFDRIKILLGNGIIVSEGEFWKRQRRMMQPTFHRRILAQFDRRIARANDRLLAAWRDKCARGEPVNVTDDMSEMTLEIILGAIFGDDLEAMAREAGENPFAVLTQESARDLRFAYRFRKLAALIGQCVARRRAAGGDPAGDSPDRVDVAERARQGDRGWHDRQRSSTNHTMVVRHRDHRQCAELDLVPLGEHPGDKLHAELDATDEVAVPSLQAMDAPWSNRVIRERAPAAGVVVPQDHRGRHTRRLHGAARHRRILQPVFRAPAPGFLDRCGILHAGALRGGRRVAPETDLPALLRRRAPLHRRDARDLRDAGAPEPLRAPLPAAPRRPRSGAVRGVDQSAGHQTVYHAPRTPHRNLIRHASPHAQ
jgi:cytochrome P450